MVNRHARHARHGQTQRGEVGLQVGHRETAAELDDRDALTGPVYARGKVVKLRNLGWGELRQIAAGCMSRPRSLASSEVRPRLRTIVQTEDAHDDALEIRRDHDRPRASPVAPGFRMRVLLKRDAERGADVGGVAREDHAAPRDAGFHDRQFVGLGKRLDLGDVFGHGTVGIGHLFPGHVFTFPGRLGRDRRGLDDRRHRRARPQTDGYLDPLVRMHWANQLGFRHGRAMAPRKLHFLRLR